MSRLYLLPFCFFASKGRALRSLSIRGSQLASLFHFSSFKFFSYMDIMQILKDQMSGQVLDQLSAQIGATPDQTAAATNGVFASILGGLANNAASPDGLSSLMGAIDRDHDGSVMDDLLGLVTGTSQNPQASNGLGILGHILGGNQEPVAQQVSQSSGLNMQQVMRLMPILAPIVMGVLGKMRNQGASHADANNGIGSIGDLAGILMGSVQNASQNHGMGDLLGSVLGQVLGGGAQQQQQQGGGIFGQILGGLLK